LALGFSLGHVALDFLIDFLLLNLPRGCGLFRFLCECHLGLRDVRVDRCGFLALRRLRTEVHIALGVHPLVNLSGRGAGAQGEQHRARENHATHVISFYRQQNMPVTITKTDESSSCAMSQAGSARNCDVQLDLVFTNPNNRAFLLL